MNHADVQSGLAETKGGMLKEGNYSIVRKEAQGSSKNLTD
jgi:hypothetical protein